MSLIRLLQLASPALPVGAYAYSQGFEAAVLRGTIASEADAATWLGDSLNMNIARWEAPLVSLLIGKWSMGNDEEISRMDREFVASRETAELREETLQMGYSLARLLIELPAFAAVAGYRGRLAGLQTPSYPTAWSAAAAAWSIAPHAAVEGYLFAWLENQMMAAIKCVPLGQLAAQRMLASLAATIPSLAREVLARDERAFGNFAPAYAIASATHETQYSRLFRS
ncbi:MAG TPA: urease accessory UreF family protein [Casimicrobiaceae bacterium]|nr:urease accessory UreF family protein [Casimicrobiaceae bacterium]